MKKSFTHLLFLSLFCITAANAQVIWEEQFDGGLNGWTSNPIAFDSNWVWTTGATVPGLAGITARAMISTPSIDNGYAMFNADFYTTQGVNNPGPNPDLYPKYVCELVSPAIDLSGVTSAVSLRFSHSFAELNSSNFPAPKIYFQVSGDGGMTWSDEVDCSTALNTNEEAISETLTFPIKGVVGSTQAHIKFVMAMDFYYWAIDDVQLLERTEPDMQSNDNFYAIAPNTHTPYMHVVPMWFLNDIENVGGQVMEDVNLNMTITSKTSGKDVGSVDHYYGTIGLDSIAENVPFGPWMPPAVVEEYCGTYHVSSVTGDVNMDNNDNSFEFNITENVFSKEFVANTALRGSADPSWTWGNYYRAIGDGTRADKAYFGIDNACAQATAAAGRSFTITLFQWTDDPAAPDGLAQEDERTTLGFAIYTPNGTEDYNNGLIEVELEGFNGEDDLNLYPNGEYLIMVRYDDDLGSPINCFCAANNATSYDAAVFVSDSIARRDGGLTYYSDFLDVGNTGEYSSGGFNGDPIPAVRLGIVLRTDNDDELSDESLTIFPNPASVNMDVAVKLENASDIDIQIFTKDGRAISVDSYDNVSDRTITYNVASLASGSYMMRLSSDYGVITKSFVVVK